MAKTNWIQIDAYLTWAKVFEQNRDTAEQAKKSGVNHKGVLKFLEKVGGQYTVDVTPATQEDLDKVKKYLSKDLYGGNPRFKASEYGAGESFQLSRKHLDSHTFKDRETGEDKVFDFGGQPDIVWWNDDKGKDVPYVLNDSGWIGEGTLAKVKFSVYQNDGEPTVSDTVRLEKIGIIDLVEVERSENSGERF